MTRRGIPWTALLVGACASTEILQDEGQICLDQDRLIVTMDACLRSSCDALVGVDCELTLDGDTVAVTAQAVIRRNTELVCSKDCGSVVIPCDTLDLTGLTDPQVRYAGETTALDALACTD